MNQIQWRAVELLRTERTCVIDTNGTHTISPLNRGEMTVKVTPENEFPLIRAADEGRADDFRQMILKGRVSKLFPTYEDADAFGRRYYTHGYYLKSE